MSEHKRCPSCLGDKKVWGIGNLAKIPCRLCQGTGSVSNDVNVVLHSEPQKTYSPKEGNKHVNKVGKPKTKVKYHLK